MICEHPPTVEWNATGDVVVVPGRHKHRGANEYGVLLLR